MPQTQIRYRKDTVKWKIADLILRNPRLSNDNIAKKCGTTVNVVYTVKADLRRDGLLEPKRFKVSAVKEGPASEAVKEEEPVKPSETPKEPVLQGWGTELGVIMSKILQDPYRTELFDQWKVTFGFEGKLGDFLVDAFDWFFEERKVKLVDMGGRKCIEYFDPKTQSTRMPLRKLIEG